ncbi:MAG TPA: hypothetical protein DDX54_01235 [Rhodospirillaceae bacterium]|jgi:hypothetical protein|nr:hypothetical protein [Alphaproteobacteria bacterium]HBH26018.1 hypothetical protein [Rhodospirillaceae bacterium]
MTNFKINEEAMTAALQGAYELQQKMLRNLGTTPQEATVGQLFAASLVARGGLDVLTDPADLARAELGLNAIRQVDGTTPQDLAHLKDAWHVAGGLAPRPTALSGFLRALDPKAMDAEGGFTLGDDALAAMEQVRDFLATDVLHDPAYRERVAREAQAHMERYGPAIKAMTGVDPSQAEAEVSAPPPVMTLSPFASSP